MQGRITKELTELSTNPPENCQVSLVGDNIAEWRVNIFGPADSPYEGGNFEVILTIPANYPFKPPEARFVTKVYHPNVKSDDGSICAEVYQANWGPTKSVRHVVEIIINMLLSPNPDHAVEAEIARQMMENYEAFQATAQEWVNNYAR